MPAEVFETIRIAGRHHVAGVGSEVEKREPEYLAGMVAGGELRHGVMDVLVLLVFDLQRYDGQTVEKEDEINLQVRLPKVKMWTEGDAVLAMFLCCSALRGAWLGVVEAKLQTAHRQTVAQDHPERRACQFLAQRPEYLVPCVRAIVVHQLLERIGLRGVQERPELVFGDEVLGIRNVGLFKDAVAMLADEEFGDVLLKGQ